MRRAVIFISGYPLLKRSILFVIRRLGLYGVVRTVYARLFVSASGAGVKWGSPVPLELANLTPHAHQIYAELKSAIEHSQMEHG